MKEKNIIGFAWEPSYQEILHKELGDWFFELSKEQLILILNCMDSVKELCLYSEEKSDLQKKLDNNF